MRDAICFALPTKGVRAGDGGGFDAGLHFGGREKDVGLLGLFLSLDGELAQRVEREEVHGEPMGVPGDEDGAG